LRRFLENVIRGGTAGGCVRIVKCFPAGTIIMFNKLARLLQGRREKKKRRLRVYMDTNWSCNIACRICLHSVVNHAPVRHGTMSPDLFERIAREVFPITRHLSLSCSAEPLMSEGFVDMLGRIGKYKVPFVEFITNATLLNPDKINAIISSGVDLVMVSVDSAGKDVFEKIRCGARFERVIGNLEMLQKAKQERGVEKPAVRFSAVLMRSTIEGIEDLMHLAHRLGAEGIHFRHFIPYAPLYLHKESLFYHKELANRYIAGAQALARELNFETFHIPDVFRDDAGPAETAINCRLPWEAIFIRANGNVVPCEPQLSIVMGNLAEQSFDEIWNSDGYRKLRDELTTGNYRSACIKCPAVVSGHTSDPMAFQEIILPGFNDVLQIIAAREPFSEQVAVRSNKSMGHYYCIKPDYDLFSGSGVTPEKLEKWRRWYEATLKIRDKFDAD